MRRDSHQHNRQPAPSNSAVSLKSPSRPRTLGTPRKGTNIPSLPPAAGEMDVSNVNPEEIFVDYQIIEPGNEEISGEIDQG